MKIEITLTELEEKILNNDLVDIQAWADDAIRGKVNNCKKRMMAEWQPKLMADPEVESIPATEEGFISTVTTRADYLDRAARDAADRAKEATNET